MKRRKYNFALAISVSLVLGSVVAPRCSVGAESATKKTMAGYTSYGPALLPFLLEKDLRFFHEEGLAPEFILVRGGGVVVRGLIAANFDYVLPTGSALDAIIRAHQPLKIVFTSSMIRFWLVAQADIRTVTDLKGKKVGLSSPGSNTDLIMREILKRHNLDPFRDVTLVGVGASHERFAALTSGSVHAAVLSPPFNLKALEIGYRKLASASDYVRWPQSGLGAREETILRDPQEVTRIVRASLKGLKFVLGQKEYALGKMMQMFRLNREEAVQTYDALQEEFIPSGYLTHDEERNVISVMKQAANVTEDIPPERVFDNRFVKQVEQELKNWKPQIPR